ncbi:hypothetical protein PsorP6_011621 [Peronosclerospora sorghi]|uniref:Uncharacterized protein n=1 Tax=Peronosclerospora sorghi TaxID=230839 RepID=A0ACC0WKI1_9STRA|nr:hypothetical protein PsorP6_011621 [Peronosclerospora sorghi]
MSVLKWIVMTNQPWDLVESRYFKEMIANAKKKAATVPSNNTLEKKLSEYRLGVENIVAMVSGTCANVKKAGKLMDCEWIGCFNHVLELSKKLKEACKYRNISGGISILQDVATRWWSRHTMLKRMVKLKPVLLILGINGNIQLPLSSLDWSIIELSIKLELEVFGRAEMFMEAKKRVTISLVPTDLRSIRHYISDTIAKQTTTTTAATSEEQADSSAEDDEERR